MGKRNNKGTYVSEILGMIGAKTGDRFYCKVCGYVALDTNGEEAIVFSTLNSKEKKCFTTRLDGRMFETGEVMVFPSKTMQDWEKLKISKGDVVVSEEGNYAIFEKWARNSGYSRMLVRHIITPKGVYSDNGIWLTECSSRLEPDSMCERNYLEKLQNEHGILNPETLELKKRCEFKDGDIVYLNTKNGLQYVFAYDANKGMLTSYIVAYCITLEEFAHIETQYICRGNMINRIRPATDSEKKQLFEALAKEGKKWDSDTKQIVDLPKKCEFKAFDKVLVRDGEDCAWKADFFSHYDKQCNKPYCCVGNIWMEHCIPYNDQTKHLLGTTEEYEA